MTHRPDPRTLEAVLRLLEARFVTAAVCLVELRPGAARFWAGGGRMAAYWPREAVWHRLDPPVERLLAMPAPVRIYPGALGLPGRACLVQGLRNAAGVPVACLTVLEAKPRRPGGVRSAAVADAAAVLAALLDPQAATRPERPALDPVAEPAARDAEAARAPHERATLSGTILPQAAAHRRIAAALGLAGAPMALMLLDLDRFRAVNEALGTAAGDALLAAVAARLDAALGPEDRLIRLDGDHFAVLTPRPEADLARYAQTLLDRIGQPLALGGQTVAMRARVGIVAAVAPGLPVPVLLTRADTALRRAKSEGSCRIVLYEPRLDAAALERSQLELELANAPANGEMTLVYQPYIELGTGRVSGVEALIRWRHPRRGTIQPNAFIPLAEATGLILPLGNWALQTACFEAARWPRLGTLSVNISALQFHQPGFTAVVDAALAASGFPADRLELEITETVLMRDNPETIGQLRALIGRGIRIALDDFGTGYSALAYLARLPHHRIKLDRSFVRDHANPATADLMRAITAMASAQEIAVTAEGVELPEHVDAVRAMGFTHAQGFATGSPMSDPSRLFSARRRVAAQ